MRFIDTNVFLRYFTQDNEKKANNSLQLLKKIETNEEKVTTSTLVIFETIFTLHSFYKVSRAEIKDLLLPIIRLRGLRLENKEIFEKALDSFSTNNISFADTYNACFMISLGINEIYSYDEDFDSIPRIKRIEP
jgi:predicted nucleic acid-binding protein